MYDAIAGVNLSFSRWKELKRYIREVVFLVSVAQLSFGKLQRRQNHYRKEFSLGCHDIFQELKYHQVGNLYGLRIGWSMVWSKVKMNSDGQIFRSQIMPKFRVGSSDNCLSVVGCSKSFCQSTVTIQPILLLHLSLLSFLLSYLVGWGQGWKNLLNNLRLVIQPFIYFNLIKTLAKSLPIPSLSLCFFGWLHWWTISNYCSNFPTSPAFLFSSA